MPSTATKASVIIPTFKREKMLFETLKNICKISTPELEILIIEQSNEGTEDVKNWIQENVSDVRYFKIQEVGLPNARNFGISQAKNEILLFCDDDVRLGHRFFEAHIKNFTRAEVGGVVGRVLDKKEAGKNYQAKKPTGRIRYITGNQIDHFTSTVKQDVEHGQGCNFSFRKSILISIGGFDTRFGGSAFLEDTDICLRVKQAGFKIIFEPDAELIHLKSNSGGCRINKPQQWYYWYGHNYTLLYLKHFSKKFFLPFFVFRMSNILKGAVTNNNPKIILFGLRGILEGYFTFKNDTGQKVSQI